MDIDKGALLTQVLEHYGADLSYVTESGWSRRKINCVVHEDYNPSMSVNLEEGKVHCWSCPAHGDGYDIIRMNEGLEDFGEITRWAADNLGCQVAAVRGTPKRERWKPPWSDED